MNIKKFIKQFLKRNNPLTTVRCRKMQENLQNHTPSFLCPNCIGGILFHDLGQKFMSPTVNLSINQKEFVDFILHYDEYINGTFEFFQHESLSCPCAYLSYAEGKKITVIFTHYKTEEYAVKKWNDRAKRINKDNLFIFLEERDGLNENDIKSLAGIHAKGLVVFTAHPYENIPYCVYIPKYAAEGEVGNILKKSYINGAREYEKYFDFVKWFNEADGNDFDVSDYILEK